MWFDVLIYSISAIVTVISGVIMTKAIKPKKFSEKIAIYSAALCCGGIAYLAVLIAALFVVTARIVG